MDNQNESIWSGIINEPIGRANIFPYISQDIQKDLISILEYYSICQIEISIERDKTDYKIISLKIINLTSDIIQKDLPDSIKTFQDLKVLTIKNCGMKDISNLKYLAKLEHICFDFNNIIRIDSNIKKINQLETLSLANNKLFTLPDSLENCSNLYYLDLKSNEFCHFPLVITRLINLKELYINLNRFIQFPDELKNLKNLYSINFSGVPLLEFPFILSELPLLNDIRGFYLTNIQEGSFLNVWKEFLQLHPIRNINDIKDIKEFIPRLIFKIQNNFALDEADLCYPFIMKYYDILIDCCEKCQNETGAKFLKYLNKKGKKMINKKIWL